MIPREFHHITTVDKPSEPGDDHSWDNDEDRAERDVVVPEHEANVISSRIAGQSPVDPDNPFALGEVLHAPVIDIDFPAALIPSSTPGHFHLYLEKPVTWRGYQRVLEALSYAGLLEPGYVHASIERGKTFVRKPMVTKVPFPLDEVTHDLTELF